MNPQLGVEGIKKVLAFPFSLVKAIDNAKADGEITLSDIPYFIEPVTKLGDAISNAKQAKDEIKDLSSAERAELETWVAENFDIADDQLEVKIEKGIGLMLHIAEFVTVL